jgi:hypothetical protein
MKIHMHTMPGLTSPRGRPATRPDSTCPGKNALRPGPPPWRRRQAQWSAWLRAVALPQAPTSAASARSRPWLDQSAPPGAPGLAERPQTWARPMLQHRPSARLIATQCIPSANTRGGCMKAISSSHVHKIHRARHPRPERDRRPPSRGRLSPHRSSRDASPATQPSPAALCSCQLIPAFTAITGGRTDACASRRL